MNAEDDNYDDQIDFSCFRDGGGDGDGGGDRQRVRLLIGNEYDLSF